MLASIQQLGPRSFFRHPDGQIYCLGGNCRGDERECSPVTLGEYGPVVQGEIKIWFSKNIEVELIPWTGQEE